ncbi:MAG: hypothetical protein GX415_03120 [Chloroflexi bacterium]|jgi:hypothetical protein|nr:hypothetical protein [Anaerolineaceae bacterium]NLI44390.1 hypothetical protein [Chloroflexota bacterium]HOE34427.1 hypothetical protein [Anaerolineaceae bacterium]HQL27153.1 hypothetical protein [Anaerolineaceae bacterium]
MKSDNLIERYIYAISRQLPQKSREDTARELRTLIADMLAERCGEREAAEEDIRAVLIELGRPEELAQKYLPQRQNCLIGQPHFRVYQLVLKIVLAATLFGLSVAMVVELVSAPPANYLVKFGEWLLSLFSAGIQAFAYVTLIFALFYRLDVKLDEEKDFLKDLPELPESARAVSAAESIVGLVFTVLFALAFIVLPERNIPIWIEGRGLIPLLNPEFLRNLKPLLIASMGVGIVNDITMLVERRYSVPVLLTHLLDAFLTGLLAWAFFSAPKLFSPEFLDAAKGVELPNLFNPNVPLIQLWLGRLLLGLTFLGLVAGSISAIAKTIRAAGESSRQ